jgi:hypothetical protein
MDPPRSPPTRVGVVASLLAVLLASAAPAAQAGEGRASTRRLADHPALAGTGGPAPCAADDLDCRAFTGTLAWRPDETRPLLSSTSLRRLVLLRHLPGGQRERALRCLAFIAWAEARSDGVEGMRAVIVAVLNRARDPALGGHPCATVGRPGAFEPMDEPEYRRTAEALRRGRLPPFPRPASVVDRRALEVARLLAFRMAHAAGLRDPTGGATHFLAPRVLARRGQAIPAWTRGLERTARIGGHHFYRRPAPAPGEP